MQTAHPDDGAAAAVRRGFAYASRGIAWLDNAATTQRPECVIAAMDDFLRHHNANVRRGVHRLAADVAGADLLDERPPLLGGGLEGMPLVVAAGLAAPEDAFASVEQHSYFVGHAVEGFRPADVLAHGSGL